MSIKGESVQERTLYVVATPIGNLADISHRALSVLSGVDLIAAEDTRHTRKLLTHFSLDKPLISLHEHNEREKTSVLIEKLMSGQSIALVSDAGTPLISDPGYPLVNACRQQDLSVVPIPGPSAIISALSVSGLPTDSFRFCGFPPRQSGKRKDFYKEFIKDSATLVFYESSHRIKESLADCLTVFGKDREAVIARELTKMFETVLTGTFETLCEQLSNDDNQSKGEFVVMVKGQVRDESATSTSIDVETLLEALLEELPVKKAAALTAKLTGKKKNDLYQQALALKKD